MAVRRQGAEALLARVRAVLPCVLEGRPVVAAYVYGSVAAGTMTPRSDLDVALVLGTTLDPYERLLLELAIQAEVEDALQAVPVDVRAIDEAPLMVRGKIVQTGVLVYERDRRARVAFEVETRKRYFDFAPSARRLRAAFLQHVREKGLSHGRS
jgi:uncharacterized protein